MKKMFLLFILAFGITFVGRGQLLVEQFNYTVGTLLTANGWTAHSGAGTNSPVVVSPGLTYSGYVSSGGNCTSLLANGEDDNKAFTSQTSGSVYAAALVRVSSASATADYFFHLFQSATIFSSRLYVKIDGSSNVAFGILRGSTAASVVFTSFSYALNTTYLVVLKYTFNPGTNDDVASLFINPATDGIEPSPTVTASDAATDLLSISAIAVRQGTAGNLVNAKVGSIRVATNWTDIIGTAAAPTTQATNVSFSSVASTTFTVSWTNGNGSNRAVFIKQANTGTAAPVDNTTYTASTTFGSGTQIGSSGWYCIYNGTGTTVSVSGLTASTDYIVHVCEYNGAAGSELYNITSLPTNPLSQTTASGAVAPSVTTTAVSGIGSTSATFNGNITADGGSSITDRGFCYKTSSGVTISDNKTSEGGTATGTYSKSFTLSAATNYFYKAYATNSAGTTLSSTEISFYTFSNEPTSHVTGFAAAAGSTTTIDLSWTVAATGADGYIILQRLGASAPTGTPTDGTGYSVGNTIGDGTVAALVIPGSTLAQTISSLAPSTQYSFTIIPFAWDGANAATYNYYTSPTIPSATATTNTPPVTTYTWQGADNASWAVATNWNPTRTTPASNDLLQFNDGTTKTVTAVPTETIGQLILSGNTTVNLQASGANILTIAGGTGTDLDVPSGSALNITGSNALTITLSTGATGSISGTMAFSGAAHKLNAADAAGVIFNSGSSLTQGTLCTSNIFTSAGTANAIRFMNGSTFYQDAGSNPFALTAPASKVEFQTGSLFKLRASLTPSFSGRTYANFELDATGASLITTGAAAVSIDNLTITNGTLNFNMTGTPGHSIKGNITVALGATLNFNPASAGTVNLNGSATQTISGLGTITSGTTTGTNSTLVINTVAGVILDANASLTGNFTITAGSFTINTGKNLTVNGTLTNSVGNSALLINSDATGTGSLIHNTAGVAATVQRYLTGYTSADDFIYHIISSPVTAQVIQPEFVNLPNSTDDFYKWDEPTATWINSRDGSGNWNSSFELNFAIGRGYLVAYPSNLVKAFTGALNTYPGGTPLTLTCTYTDPPGDQGWNMIGNPFPSSLDWDLVTRDGIDNALYYYDASLQKYQYYIRLAPGISVGGGTKDIPPMQGFFVHANNTGAMTVKIDNTMRNANGLNIFHKKFENTADNYLVLKADNGIFSDEAYVVFFDQATPNYDGQYDALKRASLNPQVPQLYTVAADNSDLAINSLPVSASNTAMPLHFKAGTDGAYTITASELNTFAPEVVIILEDLQTNQSQNLMQNPVYSFTASTGDAPGRFLLYFFGPVGIDEGKDKPFVNIYSYGDKIYISSEKILTGGSVYVFNLLGQQVISKPLAAQNLNIIPAGDMSGYYLVRVVSDKGSVTGKVFVK